MHAGQQVGVSRRWDMRITTHRQELQGSLCVRLSAIGFALGPRLLPFVTGK